VGFQTPASTEHGSSDKAGQEDEGSLPRLGRTLSQLEPVLIPVNAFVPLAVSSLHIPRPNFVNISHFLKNSTLRSFLQHPVTTPILPSNILPSTHFSNTLKISNMYMTSE
jgi:hypothetical protein